MTTDGGGTAASTIRTLWRRAPLWRLFLMLAALLTLLFALFPPHPPAPASTSRPPLANLPAATYAPRSPPTTTPAPTVMTPKPTVATPKPSATKPATPHPAPPAVAPQTATLALIRQNNASATEDSGLDPALLGPLYHGSVTVDGFTVPLPPGAWADLAHSSITMTTATGDVHFLGRISHKRLTGAIRLFAVRSKATPGAGFNEVKSCTEVNPGRTYVAIDGEMTPQGHQACWTIRDVYSTPWMKWGDKAVKLSFIDRAAAGDLAAKGVSYPQDLIQLMFTRTESWGLLEVGYLFSPEAEGITSNTVLAVTETDWTPANIVRYPEKQAYIEKLKAWGVDFWPRFKQAFDAGSP